MHPEVTRTRYIRRALTLHYYYSLALGIISLRYDFYARRFKRAPLLKVYALLVNALMICIMPLTLPYSLKNINFYGDNRLMRLTHTFNLYVRCSVFTLTLMTRWRREQRAKTIVEQLLQIEAAYFDGLRTVPDGIQRRFQWLFYAKYFSFWSQMISAVYTFVRVTPEIVSAWMLLLYIYILNVLNVLHGMMFHYFVALWHICKRFCILNAQLEAIFRKLKRHKNLKSNTSALLAAELHTIACLHYRLTQLVVQLNDIYKYQIMGVLLMQILNNTAIGYYSVIMSGGSGSGRAIVVLNFSDKFWGCILLSVTLFDTFLMDVIYDDIALSCQQTAEVLKRYHELIVRDSSLAQSCDLLSQHLMQRKLRIEICGLFVLNKNSAFLIFGAIINHVFILVQFDVERRFG